MRIRVFIDDPQVRVPPEAWANVALGVCESAERWISAIRPSRAEEMQRELRELEARVRVI